MSINPRTSTVVDHKYFKPSSISSEIINFIRNPYQNDKNKLNPNAGKPLHDDPNLRSIIQVKIKQILTAYLIYPYHIYSSYVQRIVNFHSL